MPVLARAERSYVLLVGSLTNRYSSSLKKRGGKERRRMYTYFEYLNLSRSHRGCGRHWGSEDTSHGHKGHTEEGVLHVGCWEKFGLAVVFEESRLKRSGDG